MSDDWIDHLSHVLKLLETETNGQSVRELRRSFEASKPQKQLRMLVQLEALYEICRDTLPCDTESFITDWNHSNHQLVFGLKVIGLKSTQKTGDFQDALKRLFSRWDASIWSAPTPFNSPEEESILSTMGVNSKQMKMAMRKMGQMNDNQLASFMKNIPGMEDNLSQMDPETLPDTNPMKAMIKRVKSVTGNQ